ncbi:MAG: nitroreductase family protein [Deltaproteobacteria bacterium]|nr:nitroreductase family protein [Deltaproteobacteria bacterium]
MGTHYKWKMGKITIQSFIVLFVMISCGTAKHDILTDGPLTAIQLPAPKTHGGMPLMDALKNRQSNRSFSPKPLELQVLSDLLWAAFGINRPESGRRTAPSALNWQETDIYVFTEKGAYLYEAESNILHPVVAGNFHGETGSFIQPFVKTAPVNLVYVVDVERTGLMGKMISTADREMFSATAVGFIGQNVYLYCSSAGMATVVRGLVDRDALRERLNLRPEQKVILAQSVGYPADYGQTSDLSLGNIKDGQYPGEAPFDDLVYRVMVTVKDHRIKRIEIVDIGSDEFRKEAVDVTQSLLSAQALPVDAMSGATPASQALLKAVENALHQAAKNAD